MKLKRDYNTNRRHTSYTGRHQAGTPTTQNESPSDHDLAPGGRAKHQAKDSHARTTEEEQPDHEEHDHAGWRDK